MIQDTSKKMILKKVPYIRVWANLFNYKSREGRKDFILDFILIIITKVSLFTLFLYLLRESYDPILELLMVLNIYILFLQSLSLFSRRFTDLDLKFGYSFFSLALITIPFMFIVCLGKSKDEYDEKYLIKKNKKRKIFLIISCIVSIAFIPLSFIGLIIYDVNAPDKIIKKSTDIEKYEKIVEDVEGASEFMPALDDLNSYTNINFGYKRILYSFLLGFESDNISLFVTYDSNYIDEKENVLCKYDYLKIDEIIDSYDSFDGDFQFPVTTFEYKGYTFQIVPYRNKNYNNKVSCQSFMMVGYNDLNSTIAYLYFYNMDLDLLYNNDYTISKEERMQKFIDEEFIWYDL